MRNIRLDICYDGTRYQGRQRLGNDESTIQGKIETALSRILGEAVEISGSGRTDAGVHARGQVANFHCTNPMPCEQILEQLRRYLPGDIGIYSCRQVSDRFHARLNVKGKTYCYRIWNSRKPCVFERRFVHQTEGALDVERMHHAAAFFLGEHDFSAFCAAKSKKKSTVRIITEIRLESCGDELRLYVTGNGFLYNMVRIIAGTLIEVGLGERSADSIPQLFGAKRAEAGFLAPPKGLCLEEVYY